VKLPWLYLSIAAALPWAAAQQKHYDLVGTVDFKVSSSSGRVENLMVTIGDGGSGKHKSVLVGDSSLPTHAIYRPRDLAPFGGNNLLPIVAFGNGGCRNGSGEFRNFLSDIASHGYLVVAIGPAGDAVVGGSEGRTWMTQSSQLMDGVDWATKQNNTEGSEYFHKIDPSKVAVMGQSCGTRQAQEVSGDPRVTTTVLMNGGGPMGARGAAAPAATQPPAGNAPQAQAPGAYGNTTTQSSTQNILTAIERLGRRYAPYAPAGSLTNSAPAPSQQAGPVTFHGPVAFINGGPSDTAYNGAVSGFEAVNNVPALLAFQDVGHYPATYREPNGGAFAVAANAWLDWNLKGDQSASKMFVGPNCGLCSNPKWRVQIKNVK
jgi:hypothetical protein